MLLREIRTIFHNELESLYHREEVESFFGLLLSHVLGLEKFVLALHPDLIISKESETHFFSALRCLKAEQPIQYILGEAWFMDLKLSVNEHVLIPRPETEELVRWVLTDINNNNPQTGTRNAIKILDIGTGSGCIAIALAKFLKNSEVHALDISEDVLNVARENADSNHVNVSWIKADILEVPELRPDFDVIICNPPYVRQLERADMDKNVKDYEPSVALFVPDDHPLLFYERIADLASKTLPTGGRLYFEINQYLGRETIELMEARKYSNIELRQDVFGNDRMLKGIRP